MKQVLTFLLISFVIIAVLSGCAPRKQAKTVESATAADVTSSSIGIEVRK